MKQENFIFKAPSGASVFTYVWLPEGETKAVLQISHGMVETAARYERLAGVLTAAGFAVVANDHLGHGKTAPDLEGVGHLEKGDFDKMVRVVHDLTGWIKERFAGKKVFLLGHSMGSFIVQYYIENYGSEIDGVILSGTAGKDATVPVMAVLVDILTAIRGAKTRAKWLNDFQFGGYNKLFSPNRTPADWLSRDEAEVDKYIANPYCGAVATYGFFQALTDGLNHIHREDWLARIPKDLPIYLYAGKKDPVGKFNKTIFWLVQKYKSLGIKDVQYKFYPGGRHEMLNETNRDEVMADILKWLSEKSA